MPQVVENAGALPSSQAARPTDPLAAVLAAAESAIGVQYRWGGNSLASGVDCSGLVQQAFRAAGIVLPRVSAAQANTGQRIGSIGEAQPGDLLSWDNSSRNNGADHIAIYLGNGLMIEAYKTGAPVRVTQVRGTPTVTRVLGVVQPSTGVAAPVLGPNQDRVFTAAAVMGGAAPTAQGQVVPASQVTGLPSGGLGDGLPPNASPAQVEDYIREHFPSAAPFLQNAEIRNILTTAAREDWSSTKVDQAFRGTEYFRTHAAPSREVDAFLGTAGAAEVRRVTDLGKQAVNNLFSQNGLKLDDKDLSGLTMQAMRSGYINTAGQVVNEQGLNGLLSYRLAANGKMPSGAASLNADALGATARQYLVPVTRSSLEDWTRRIIAGSASEEQFRSWLNDQAKSTYNQDESVMNSLNAGMTVDQHFQAHRAAIAQTLELDESQVDLMDRRYRDVLQYRDPATGKVRSMTWAEAEKWARSRPEFANTRSYRSEAAQTQTQLAKFFGKTA